MDIYTYVRMYIREYSISHSLPTHVPDKPADRRRSTAQSRLFSHPPLTYLGHPSIMRFYRERDPFCTELYNLYHIRFGSAAHYVGPKVSDRYAASVYTDI